jgi:hypothetical protein
MARRDEGASPEWGCDRGATKPGGLLRENPPGGESFARGLRWLVPYSPLRGCSELASLSTGKILRRRPPPNFKTGSQTFSVCSSSTSTPCGGRSTFPITVVPVRKSCIGL